MEASSKKEATRSQIREEMRLRALAAIKEELGEEESEKVVEPAVPEPEPIPLVPDLEPPAPRAEPEPASQEEQERSGERTDEPQPEPQAPQPTSKPEPIPASDTEPKINLEGAFTQARTDYLEKYKVFLKANPPRLSHLRKILGIAQKEVQVPEEVEALKAHYEDLKANYAKTKYEEKEEKLVRQRVDNLDEELTKYQLVDLYKEFVIDERSRFKQAQAEVVSPKDKSRIEKLYGVWDRRNRWEKLVISRSALLIGTVGYAALTGGIGAVVTPGMMFFAGRKFVNMLAKGVGGAAMGAGFGVGFDATLGKYLTRRSEESKEDEEAALKREIISSFDYLKNASDRYDKIMQSHENRAQRKTLYKALGMMAVGAGSVQGLNWFEQNYFPAGSIELQRPSTGGYPKENLAAHASLSNEGADAPEQLQPEGFETIPPKTGGVDSGVRTPISPEISPEQGAEIEKLTRVEQGEGFWQPVYRQLEDQLKKDPDGFAEKYKWPYRFDKELLETEEYRKDILNRETQHLLTENKKILADGEMWLKKPGVHVLLQDDGKIAIAEGEEMSYKWSGSRPRGAAPAERPLVSDISLKPRVPQPEIPRAVPIEIGDTAPSTRLASAVPTEYPANIRGGGMSENMLEYGKPATPPTPDKWADIGAMGERTGIYTETAPKVPGPEFVFSEFGVRYLNHLAEYKRNFSDTMLVDLAHKMNGGRITAENFWTYYQNRMGVTSMRRSVFDQMINEMKANVEKIVEGSEEEKGRALNYLRTYVEAMRAKK